MTHSDPQLLIVDTAPPVGPNWFQIHTIEPTTDHVELVLCGASAPNDTSPGDEARVTPLRIPRRPSAPAGVVRATVAVPNTGGGAELRVELRPQPEHGLWRLRLEPDRWAELKPGWPVGAHLAVLAAELDDAFHDGVDPELSWCIIFGDVESTPIMTALVDALPPEIAAHIAIEFDEQHNPPEFRGGPRAIISWVDRAKDHGLMGFAERVRLPPHGAGAAWIIAERDRIADVREVLHRRISAAGAQNAPAVHCHPTWARAQIESDQHAP